MSKIIKDDVNLINLYLTSLPSILSDTDIKGDLYCSHNRLTTLKGAPISVDGHFYCANNQVKFTEEQVRAVCKVGGLVYV